MQKKEVFFIYTVYEPGVLQVKQKTPTMLLYLHISSVTVCLAVTYIPKANWQQTYKNTHEGSNLRGECER